MIHFFDVDEEFCSEVSKGSCGFRIANGASDASVGIAFKLVSLGHQSATSTTFTKDECYLVCVSDEEL